MRKFYCQKGERAVNADGTSLWEAIRFLNSYTPAIRQPVAAPSQIL